MSPDQLAQIIYTGEIPLAVKGDRTNDRSVKAALHARQVGLYEGLDLAQIEERLRQNRIAAEQS